MVSSVGLFGVPPSSTESVPPFVDVRFGSEIVPVFGPSLPKESLFKTSIVFAGLFSLTVAVSSVAVGRPFTVNVIVLSSGQLLSTDVITND